MNVLTKRLGGELLYLASRMETAKRLEGEPTELELLQRENATLKRENQNKQGRIDELIAIIGILRRQKDEHLL